VVGDRWNPHSHEIKDFLARNQIPYRWLDVERSDEARTLVGCVADPLLPLVLFPEGEPMRQLTKILPLGSPKPSRLSRCSLRFRLFHRF
jgi:thioredoxin reductase (NADPH)